MIETLIDIAQQAGKITLEFFQQNTEIKIKPDKSLFTAADINSHRYLYAALKKLFKGMPIISEEMKNKPYNIRKYWQDLFLIDPLDGSKEFIAGREEYTVNIALVHKTEPIVGVIHVPTKNTTYYAMKNEGAFKLVNGQIMKLPFIKNKIKNPLRIAISRSHQCQETLQYLKELSKQGKEVITVPIGSALKFGLIAEGLIDIYPRFGPTMEWDVAAGHIIVNEVGKKVIVYNSDVEMRYNKVNLKNPAFIVI